MQQIKWIRSKNLKKQYKKQHELNILIALQANKIKKKKEEQKKEIEELQKSMMLK